MEMDRNCLNDTLIRKTFLFVLYVQIRINESTNIERKPVHAFQENLQQYLCMNFIHVHSMSSQTGKVFGPILPFFSFLTTSIRFDAVFKCIFELMRLNG